MSTIFIVDLEYVPTRYTAQLKRHLPYILKEKTNYDVVAVTGDPEGTHDAPTRIEATPGAFLNWSATNIYKNIQGERLARLFDEGKVKQGDVILFTDAWNPVIMQARYMKDLMDIDCKLVSIWHAGSYDPWDRLGQQIKDKKWVQFFERSVYEACDLNLFATYFHYELFRETYPDVSFSKFIRSGMPFEYVAEIPFPSVPKEDIVVFAQRLAPEKQPEMFDQLAELLPQYKFINCMAENMDKSTYHATLAKSKLMMSFALQETLGITPAEAIMANCDVLVPDRLSYSEMWFTNYKYPSNMSIKNIAAQVDMKMKAYKEVDESRTYQHQVLMNEFFSANILYEKLNSWLTH
jgi:glycosyltransferase involved in cell wall biosynthesis